jgi:hypothetical protein
MTPSSHCLTPRLYRTLVLIGIAVVLLETGCRTWPDESNNNEPAVAQGSYVGSGELGGSSANILITVAGPDSAGLYSGSIHYRSQTTAFEDIIAVTDSDSLWFHYRRDDVMYRAWATYSSSGLTIHFVEPSDVPAFRVNREINGYNMSGTWDGRMSSAYWQVSNDASLTMEQEGQSFIGTATTAFSQTTSYEVSNGVANEASFQLNATMYVGANRYSAILYGTYAARDTTSGYWQAGDNGSVDHGEFVFCRTFE